MDGVRRKPTELNEQAREFAELQREVQRVMISRLRHEDFRRLYHDSRPSLGRMATRAGISKDHLGDLESGKSALTPEMRGRLMELCELTPREWLDREADIVKKLPLTRYRTRPERLVAEPPPRGAPPAAAEDEER